MDVFFFFFGDEDSDAIVQASDESQCNTDEHVNYSESVFESIKHINEFGQEFWYARELQIALEYKQWRRFCNVIDKAKDACNGSGNIISDHFADVGKMVNIGSGAERELTDISLSRYACYLIVQNGDPRKKLLHSVRHTLPLRRDSRNSLKAMTTLAKI